MSLKIDGLQGYYNNYIGLCEHVNGVVSFTHLSALPCERVRARTIFKKKNTDGCDCVKDLPLYITLSTRWRKTVTREKGTPNLSRGEGME